MLLLEIDPPFDQRAVQLARRRMAKRGIRTSRRPASAVRARASSAGDQRGRRPARAPRRGLPRRHACRATRCGSAPPPRARRAPRRAAATTRPSSARPSARPTARKHDPFGSRSPDHSVVHRYARCLSYPEWGVGSVTGIYFTGRRRRRPAVGAREVPGRRAHRSRRLAALRRLLQARPRRRARRALRHRRAPRAGRGRAPRWPPSAWSTRATPSPTTPHVLRLLTAAFWQARNLPAAARSVRDWARVEPDRPAPHRTASRIYEDMGACLRAGDGRAERDDRGRGPQDGDAWERSAACACAAATARRRARPRCSAAAARPSVDGLLDLALAHHLAGDVGARGHRRRGRRRSSRPTRPPPGRATPTRSRAPTAASDTLAAAERALALDGRPRGRRAPRPAVARPPRELPAA